MEDKVSSNVLVLEKNIPLEIEGIQIGLVKVQVFEGEAVHLKQGDMNDMFFTAKGVFNDKIYEVKGIRGGVQAVIEDLKNKILTDLK